MDPVIVPPASLREPLRHTLGCACVVCQKLHPARKPLEEKRAPMMKAKADRAANDAYYTPAPLALAICEQLSKIVPAPRTILEPSVGSGAFLKAARARWPQSIIGVEDVDQAGLRTLRAERRGSPGSTGGDYDLIIGNPPYLDAERHVRLALERLAFGGHLAFLLRVGFIASQERAKLYRAHPIRWLIPIIGRPSFTGNGKTDPTEYAVFCWRRGFTGNGEILSGLEWREMGRGA